MALALPGERPSRLIEALLAVAAVIGLCALGCATPSRTRRLPASVFRSTSGPSKGPAPPRAGLGRAKPALPHAIDEGAALVERALHGAGLRFGTDGSTRALWGYLRTSHRLVAPAEARPGDLVLFDTRGTGPEPECADHAGIIERVDGDGRIGFLEARGGSIRHSFVDPAQPTRRRGASGQILNSFLRPITINDPPGARVFAGQMLCAVVRAAR